MIRAFTPMAGMVSQTGLGIGAATESETGVTVRPMGTATGDGLAASRTEGPDQGWVTTRQTAPAPAASSPALSTSADSSRAWARHTPDTQPATRGRRAGGRGAPTSGRRPRPTPGERRDTHKPIVVARIWPQDGSVAAWGEASGAGAGGSAAR